MFVPFIAALLQITFGPGNQQLQTPASTTAEKDKCVVAGRVLSMQTGEPLKKASLHLVLQTNGKRAATQYQMSGYSATTGPDGSFRFESVEPGNYYLRGERSGYVNTNYGSKSIFSLGTTISLQPGQQLTDVKFELIQQATITGRVLDEDGDPVSGLQVQALGRMPMGGGKMRYFPQGNASTDDTGAFRIANLRPGKYYLSAQRPNGGMMGMVDKPVTPGKPDIQQVRTYYPSSLDRTGASVIDVAAGQDMPGVEIRMRAVETYHVRGKIAGASEPKQLQQTMIMLTAEGDGMFSGFDGMAMAGPDHTFDFAHVQPGSYVIMIPNFNGEQKQTARLEVTVGNADVNGLVLTAQPGVTLRGSVELQDVRPKDEKDKPAENIAIYLSPDGNGMMFGGGQATTKADGSFMLEDVMPGKFRVGVNNGPNGTYVKSIRFGGQEVSGKPLDLTQSGGGEVHVVIRGGAPHVSGTVSVKTDSGVKPANSAYVLFIPEDLTLNGGVLHHAAGNQNGGYDENDIPPGTYYAVALEADEFRNFEDPAVLKQLVSKGIKLELKESDQKQQPLTMLAAEELQAAMAAAGAEN